MRIAADSDTAVPSGSTSDGIFASGLMRRKLSSSAGLLPIQTNWYGTLISSSRICGASEPAPARA
jgi:hypothetical protein